MITHSEIKDLDLYEIYTLDPDTGETGWDIEWVWSTDDQIESFPYFDCIITKNDGYYSDVMKYCKVWNNSHKRINKMKKAGVIIDGWKLEIFKRRLTKAGYEYKVKDGPLRDSYTLRVSYEWASDLQKIVDAASEECREIDSLKEDK